MRIAAFQRLALFDAVDKTAAVLARDLAWADSQGIDLALFPECYLQGHSYNAALARRRALSLDDPPLHALVGRFAPAKTTAIIGLFEQRGAVVHNSAIVAKAGQINGVYAKAHPLENGCAPGTDFPIWACGNWTFGINICSDLRYPYTATRLVKKGTNLLCCPLNMMLRPHKAPKWREPAIESLRACARRTGRWVMSADVVGNNDDGWMSYGCTAIIDPQGKIVARAAELVEDVVIFDLPDDFLKGTHNENRPIAAT
jgi:predicted amidohydrolase